MMLPYFKSWRTTCLLCSAGLRDEALLYLVTEFPFSSPSDREIAAISEPDTEDCVIALDDNVFWCRIAVTQAERIVRLLRAGKLALSVHAFEPNSPEVLSGGRARLLPSDAAPLAGLAIARRQPADGFKTPHHVRATLKLGPEADLSGLRRLLADISGR